MGQMKTEIATPLCRSGLSPESLEALAIRVALGNNGGTWAKHYTETQKEHWRQFIRDLADAVAQGEV